MDGSGFHRLGRVVLFWALVICAGSFALGYGCGNIKGHPVIEWRR